MSTAKLIIKNEVYGQLTGIDEIALHELQDVLTFYVPNYRFMPSFKLGRWDGKKRLMYKTGKVPFRLIGQLTETLSNHGYSLSIEDSRPEYNITTKIAPIDKNYLKGYYWPEGDEISLWGHQITAVNECLKNGEGILELATGSGKTLICGILCKLFSDHTKVLLVVPNVDLILQTQYVLKNIGIEPGIWYADVKDPKTITICTWQSLTLYPELFLNVKCIIVDEVHEAKHNSLQDILGEMAVNVPYRFGVTGTLPVEPLFKSQIIGMLGEPIFSLHTYELQQLGILAQAAVYQLQFNDKDCPKYQIIEKNGTHEMWKDEMDWMFNQSRRVEYIATYISEIAENCGNCLVLIQYKKHGKQLLKLLPDAIYLDGDIKNRTTFYREFNNLDNGILICTYGIAQKGIDIPRIFNLFVIEPGKKFEKVMQSFGRGLRIAPDKSHLQLFDISGTTKMAIKHARERIKYYTKAKQSVTKMAVNYIT